MIKSYGENIVDIQKWKIQSLKKNFDTIPSSSTYYTELASGEGYEFPAIFYLQFNNEAN